VIGACTALVARSRFRGVDAAHETGGRERAEHTVNRRKACARQRALDDAEHLVGVRVRAGVDRLEDSRARPGRPETGNPEHRAQEYTFLGRLGKQAPPPPHST
jgi:hypothetical protein